MQTSQLAEEFGPQEEFRLQEGFPLNPGGDLALGPLHFSDVLAQCAMVLSGSIWYFV